MANRVRIPCPACPFHFNIIFLCVFSGSAFLMFYFYFLCQNIFFFGSALHLSIQCFHHMVRISTYQKQICPELILVCWISRLMPSASSSLQQESTSSLSSLLQQNAVTSSASPASHLPASSASPLPAPASSNLLKRPGLSSSLLLHNCESVQVPNKNIH